MSNTLITRTKLKCALHTECAKFTLHIFEKSQYMSDFSQLFSIYNEEV